MTQDEKRIKIAEVMPAGFLEGSRWMFNGHWIIFDPFNDLNAIHEAEFKITGMQGYQYEHHLLELVNREELCGNTWPSRAAASQRAEAFGLTLNLWGAGQ